MKKGEDKTYDGGDGWTNYEHQSRTLHMTSLNKQQEPLRTVKSSELVTNNVADEWPCFFFFFLNNSTIKNIA